jgi:hypothetical protein
MLFDITSVSRDDLEAQGYEIKSVTDSMMRDLAREMAYRYVENTFWGDLRYSAEKLGFLKEKVE